MYRWKVSKYNSVYIDGRFYRRTDEIIKQSIDDQTDVCSLALKLLVHPNDYFKLLEDYE